MILLNVISISILPISKTLPVIYMINHYFPQIVLSKKHKLLTGYNIHLWEQINNFITKKLNLIKLLL